MSPQTTKAVAQRGDRFWKPVHGFDRIEHGIDIDCLQLVDQDDRRVARNRNVAHRQLDPEPVRQPQFCKGFGATTLLARRRLTLLDVERLQEVAGFNQDYLHLGGAPTEVRRYLDMLERERGEVQYPPHEPH
jgi:hypothetical protein